MSKKTRALVASAAGAAMLLTSGATFALWQADAAISGNTVLTGTLSVEIGQVTWQDRSPVIQSRTNPGTLIENPGFEDDALFPVWTTADLLSPGDVIFATIPITYELSGTNLVADVSWDGLTASNSSGNFVVTVIDDSDSLDNLYADGTHNVVVSIEFLRTSEAYSDGTGSVSLAGAKVTLTQERPEPIQ